MISRMETSSAATAPDSLPPATPESSCVPTIPDGLLDEQDVDAAFEKAAAVLTDASEVDRLFDLRMLHAKVRLGIPVTRPETLSDVPREHRVAIEEAYKAAAREAGEALLEKGALPAAWGYFQAIGEPGPVREALAKVPNPRPNEQNDERSEELSRLALYEGAYPAKGIEMMLAGVGTCGTVTALEQSIHQLPPDDRRECAAVVVRHLHDELLTSLVNHIERSGVLLRVPASISEALAGRESLLDGGGYHVDVSHLASAVRFSRDLRPEDPELPLAIELCQYGGMLDRSLQYDGEPPFEEFYKAHRLFLTALQTGDAAEAAAFFGERLNEAETANDRRLVAYVLSDLLMRCGDCEGAVRLAAEELAATASETGFSLAEMCQRAGRLDLLERYGREQGDVVNLLAGRFGITPSA